ncbi:MAG: hypothetical protein ACI304_07920 [Lepagella sp.]
MRLFNAFAAALTVAAVLSSCSEEQSAFNISAIPGRSTIEGTVLYNQGTKYVDGKFVYDYKPAAGLKIVATVKNSDYDADLKGYSTFEVTTDENGKYTLEIPAPHNDVEVSLCTASFRGTRSVVKMENNKVVTVEEPVIYQGESSVYAHADQIKYCNFTCYEASADVNPSGFTQSVDVKGRIGQNVEKYNAPRPYYNDDYELEDYYDATIEYLYTGAANVDLIIECGSFTYNATTDAKGNFSIKVPVKEFPASFDCHVRAVNYEGSFKHYETEYKVAKDFEGDDIYYTDYVARTIQGYYTQVFSVGNSMNFPVPSAVNDITGKAMIFRPNNPNEGTFGYNADKWSAYNDWQD